MSRIRRFAESLFPRTPRAGEKWLALTMLAWGAWLLLPPVTFNAGLASTFMAQVADENTWGMVGVGIGVLALVASFAPWPRVRVIMNLALTFLWFFLAGMTISVSSASSGVLYLMLGLHQAVYVYSSILDWRGGMWKI